MIVTAITAWEPDQVPFDTSWRDTSERFAACATSAQDVNCV